MNPFEQFLNTLSTDNINKLATGTLRLSVDDINYTTSPEGIDVLDLLSGDNADTKETLIKNQETILTQLYATLPLCRKEFDYQAHQLINKHHPESYCKHANSQNSRALFIEGNQLISVESNDSRHKYGYYCEHHDQLQKENAIMNVMTWLESGQAYDDYRVKTHCRYICR